MKNVFVRLLFVSLVLCGCGEQTRQEANQSLLANAKINEVMDCAAEKWCDANRDKMYEAARLLDSYLKKQKLLGNGFGADYMKFFSSDIEVQIPESTPGFDKMICLLGPEKVSRDQNLANCFNLMIHKDIEFRDGSPFDVFSNGFDVFSRSGIPPFQNFGEEIFGKASDIDMNDDAIRSLYYLMWGIQRVRFENKEPSVFTINPLAPKEKPQKQLLKKDSVAPRVINRDDPFDDIRIIEDTTGT